jgi:hypothetical protein
MLCSLVDNKQMETVGSSEVLEITCIISAKVCIFVVHNFYIRAVKNKISDGFVLGNVIKTQNRSLNLRN